MLHFRGATRRFSFSGSRLGVLLLTSVVMLSGVVSGAVGVASAQPADPPGPSHYSAPVWFPLRRAVSGAEIKVGCTYLSHGTQGGYECAGHHTFWALDLLAGTGTNIYPAGAGFARNVTGQAGYSGYGNTVVVDHGDNVESLYAHMSVVLVGANGGWVDQNTVIGKVGQTGDATTPHLHFEITSSGHFSAGSRDPGPLQACHGSQLVTYPQAWGLSTWQGIPWGTHTGYSDGTTCSSTSGPVTKAATVLVADPTTHHLLGFLGLSGTKVTYSIHLHTTTDGAAVVGATVVVTAPDKQHCSGVTSTTGTAVCRITYAVFQQPPRRSTYEATFAGDAARLPSSLAAAIS